MSNNSYSSFEKEHAQNKETYISLLKDVISKTNNKTIKTEDVLEYLEKATKYFSIAESYSHKILNDKAALKGFAVSSFADDCFAILETYLLHITLLKQLFNSHISHIDLSKAISEKALTNTQRITVQYSKKGVPELKQRFKDLELSTNGFDTKATKSEFNLSMSDRLSLIIGGVGLALILIISLFIPSPTNWQQVVLRAILSLTIGILISTVPGFLHINLTGKILDNRYKIIATGSIAAFVIIYMFNPAFVS
ncbi:hypothetical protein F884_01234 [Acinetobacter sp. CIP 102143]|nr:MULTISPECIES: hypothetical protein [Acinetobacter]ENU84538.1 hypothetical protein F974_00355 [Acinetobacter sp. CIP 102159]ENU90119.1 hypothetical protein F972_00686 [Acinetobacter sp. CIP 102529]ENX65071.1 hypothetical protein F884_01234 [Acinetobacter sp. CIP 102143]MCU4395338.1 hypothetical protein [Acinetobacter parvus]